MPGSRWAWRVAVPVTAALAGLLLATSAVTARGTELRGRRDNLPELISAEQHRLADATRTVRKLRAEVDDRARARAGQDARVSDARRRGDGLLAPAGLLPVRGPALTVVLDDAPRDRRERPLPAGVPAPAPDDLVVHQQDVQAVVNALWSGGAEAMTIMGQRVISTTAVRCVGNTLLLHGAVYSPPFRVTAIGDPAALRAALDAAQGVAVFRQYVDAYGLGYRLETAPDVRLPGYDGSVELAHARPVGE